VFVYSVVLVPNRDARLSRGMATGTVARPPPGVAFVRAAGGGPSDGPIVTFEAKRAFEAFEDSLTAGTLNRAKQPHDVHRAETEKAHAGSGKRRGDCMGRDVVAEPPSTSGAAHGEAVVRATREIAMRSRASVGTSDDDGFAGWSETPLEKFERERNARETARRTPAPFRTDPKRIPLARDMLREAALDCGVTGSRYPNGPYEPFSWVFNREPKKNARAAPEFQRHFASLKPVHREKSLGEPVDLRPLIEVERSVAEEMRAMRAGRGKYHACQSIHGTGGEFDKPFRPFADDSNLPHRPGRFAAANPLRNDGAIDADGKLIVARSKATPGNAWRTRSHDENVVRMSEGTREFSKVSGPKRASALESTPFSARANWRLAGAGASGGGFFAPGPDSDGMATRSVKTCSAYATRLIANGRVGGTVVPKDGLGRPVGGPLLGAAAARFVRRGTPLGEFRGVALEHAAREQEKSIERAREEKDKARRAYAFAVTTSGGFGYDARRLRAAAAEASAESFLGTGGATSGPRGCASFTRFPPTHAVRERAGDSAHWDGLDARVDERKARGQTPFVREYSRLTMGAAPQKFGGVWTPGASASIAVGGWTWRDAATPMPTSLERGDAAGLPRHSAARARVRKEESVRKLSLRPSATYV